MRVRVPHGFGDECRRRRAVVRTVSGTPARGPSVAEFEIAPGPTAPAAARRAVRWFSDMLPSPVGDDLRLIASELVTYGLLNRPRSEVPLTLRVERRDGNTRLEIAAGREISDLGGAERLGRDGAAAMRFTLVSTVADRWGVETRDGIVIWLEIDDPAG